MLIPRLYNRLLQFTKHFTQPDKASENKLFGFGQFVLLLTLAPFIFNLSLYSVGTATKTPSQYEYDPDRFKPLPALQTQLPPPSFSNYNASLPKLKALSKKETKKYNSCNFWKSNSKKCKALRAKKTNINKHNLKASKRYLEGYGKYLADNKNYKATQKKYKAEVIAQYRAFDASAAKPSSLPPITITQYASTAYMSILEGVAGAEQQALRPIWLLGALLITPAIILCIRRKQWALLAFGLTVPVFNYLVTMPSILFESDTLSNWQMSSAFFPQLAFIFFILKGQMRSKSFIYFIFIMMICSLLSLLASNHEGFNILKAQLPLLVFVVVSAIGRLIVKGARENAYLLKELGWAKGLRTGLRSLLLWLPMAALAIPFLYVTEVLIPKKIINQLHDKQVLVFNHTHALGLLDNTLQSTAYKTDDVIYAWHMQTQSIKKDIHDKKAKLTQASLTKISQEKFDEIIPPDLTFEEYESDTALIGWAIELSVDASQESTNKAYQTFRQSIKSALKDQVSSTETDIKDEINGNLNKAFTFIDAQYEQGKNTILQASKKTQASLWWTINYLDAAHKLTLLIFGFICIKSFMYVFARVSFNRDTGAFITLGNTRELFKGTVKSMIKPTGREYLISNQKDENYFISRRFQCRGQAPNFSIPQAFYAPIARIFNGAYTMNKITMRKGAEPVSCSATKGIEFFEWSLAEGETVIFDFYYFVGMSESIQIATLISPRMSSLLLGKMTFSQATGPGKLLLMAKGRAEIVDNQGTKGSLPPERMIAMHKDTRLHIDSELDPLNVYLSTAYIRPTGQGKIIVDVDSQRGTKAGLASFIKHFILPI